MVLETIWMTPKRPRTVSEGPGSAPEGSGMSRNYPRRSRKVLEASGRFRKFPGSTTHYPTPLALGGKPPRLPWLAKGWGRTKGEESSSRWEVQLSNMAGFRWEGLGGLGVHVALPTPLIEPQGPPGHLYNEGRGWGRSTHQTPRPMRHPPSL